MDLSNKHTAQSAISHQRLERTTNEETSTSLISWKKGDLYVLECSFTHKIIPMHTNKIWNPRRKWLAGGWINAGRPGEFHRYEYRVSVMSATGEPALRLLARHSCCSIFGRNRCISSSSLLACKKRLPHPDSHSTLFPNNILKPFHVWRFLFSSLMPCTLPSPLLHNTL